MHRTLARAPEERKLRVLQLIGGMHLGGAERVVAHLARGLDRSRFDVEVCCTKTLGPVAEQLIADGITVTRATPTDGRLRHLVPFYIRRTIGRFQPDVVHTHGAVAVLHTGLLALARSLPPWIHTFHFGNYDSLPERAIRLERFLCRRATRLVAVSDHQRESVIRRFRADPDRIMTVTNGVPANPFISDPAFAARKRAELGFAPDDVVVGTIAVLSEQKGITYLLRAARALADRDTRLRFLIVGGGRLEAPLREEAKALGLGSRVLFTGWRQDSQELMTVLDVFVMSSLWEAMPMVLLEAMAARRAIVVTSVGDNAIVVDDGRSGVLVPPRDVDALVSAIGGVAADRDRARRLGDAAQHAYHERFSVEAMLGNHEQLYARIAADGIRQVATRSARATAAR